MASSYSERFLHGQGAGFTKSFTVPSGHRAVLRHIALTSSGTAGDWGQVIVAGVLVLTYYFPAALRYRYEDVRFTAYAGEQLTLAMGGSQMGGALNGFLFREDLRSALLGLPASSGDGGEDYLAPEDLPLP